MQKLSLAAIVAIVMLLAAPACQAGTAGYRLGLQRLIAATGRDIAPGRCIAIEDSPAGIAAACGAALHVLGVTTSYPAQRLAQADRVVDSLADVSLDSLDELLQ